MLLCEEDSDVFKRWVLPKLEIISDADAEVLADYVIALVTSDDSEGDVRRNCLESLADFLQDHTAPFVEDVVKALKSKSYVSRAHKKTTSNHHQQPEASSTTPHEPHPPRSINTPPLNAPTGPAASRASRAHPHVSGRPTAPEQSKSPGVDTQQERGNSSRKRKQVQRDTSETRQGQDPHYNRTGAGGRPTKQTARRGGKNAVSVNSLRGSAAPFEPQNALPGFAPMPKMPAVPNTFNMAGLPPPPSDPIPFDMNNSMAFLAMMAALGTTMPGMPPLPTMMSQANGTNGQAAGKCHDYHERGFCALGNLCSFEHGDTGEDVPEYDPAQPALSMRHIQKSKARQGVYRPYPHSVRGGRPRATFSLPGPATDDTNTTLVVEQIPDQHFTEDNVRGYFSQFGTIVDVQMHAYNRLAVVKYEDHSAASQAYNNPKAVFENRFVKVYWKKPDTVIGPSARGYGDVEMADADNVYHFEDEVVSPEEIEKRQAEAQKAFEERRRKVQEADAKAADIERQLKEKDVEMRKIRRKLAELAGEEYTEANEAAIKDFSQDLATLQAEAENLFGTTNANPPASLFRGRGGYTPRGAYRGRGLAPFSLRGRGAPRGAYRGRGAFGRPYSRVRKLDNRPRRIAVAGIEKGSSRDEALRQYLLGLPECTSIEQHPEQPDTIILTFQERYQAESFLDDSRTIPDTGALELSWVPNDAFGGLKSTTTTTIDDIEVEADASDDESDGTVEEGDDIKIEEVDADMDVADDVDQWL